MPVHRAPLHAAVTYRHVDTAVGRLFLVRTQRGVVRVAFRDQDADFVLDSVTRQVGPAAEARCGQLDDVYRQIVEYLDGDRREFAVPLDTSLVGPAQREVLRALCAVPFGAAVTAGELAVAVGRPAEAAAVGLEVAANPLPILIPCHRVLRVGPDAAVYPGGCHVRHQLRALEARG